MTCGCCDTVALWQAKGTKAAGAPPVASSRHEHNTSTDAQTQAYSQHCTSACSLTSISLLVGAQSLFLHSFGVGGVLHSFLLSALAFRSPFPRYLSAMARGLRSMLNCAFRSSERPTPAHLLHTHPQGSGAKETLPYSPRWVGRVKDTLLCVNSPAQTAILSRSP